MLIEIKASIEVSNHTKLVSTAVSNCTKLINIKLTDDRCGSKNYDQPVGT